MSGFTLAGVLWDIARNKPHTDLQEGFFAEMIHLVAGVQGHGDFHLLPGGGFDALGGREAAQARTEELDRLWGHVQQRMSRYPSGLEPQSVQRRIDRTAAVMAAMNASPEQWRDWHWQTGHLLNTVGKLAQAARLSQQERFAIERLTAAGLPFAVTPYYASLMDDDGEDDRAIRMQVIPPTDYVEQMLSHSGDRQAVCDFMRESDTSPVDLVTRRYPAIAILKPFNTCPQICVYCQRNWEITGAMEPAAMAPQEKIDGALEWIAKHPAISEVLVTGGDPLVMDDRSLGRILQRLAAIDSIDMIRIGTRTPVTLPMRITPSLAEFLGSFRKPGHRDIAIVTHVEHPYEITPELVQAVDLLRRQGIGVYNQQVYTFYVSRRFETAKLRMILRRAGIDPYYTFATKGKEETASYRVPIARLLQERKEEARLLPGLRRTDEPVYNLPRLGKNYLRATQHHDLLAVLGDGRRVYEFHPWEKNVVARDSYVATDVSILDYLRRLEEIGENAADYSSIWYYY